MHFDLKPTITYIGAIFLGDLNQGLQAAGLIANLLYIAFQYKRSKQKDIDQE